MSGYSLGWDKKVPQQELETFESLSELNSFYLRLSGLLRDGPLGLAGVNNDAKIRYWSKGCENVLGYRSEEVIGARRLTELSNDSGSLIESMERSFSEGHFMREQVFTHKDGSPRILYQLVLPIFLRQRRHVGFTFCLLDVTDRRETEEALRRERNMFNLVLDAMGAGIAIFDSDARLQWANSALIDWFGQPEGTIKGLQCNEVYRCLKKNCKSCALGVAVETGLPQSSEIERTDASGNWYCFLQTATPIKLGRSQFLVLTLDVTEERRRKEHLWIVNDLAKSLTRSLDPAKVQHLVLTCVTAGHALGFNRAFLFLTDEDSSYVRGSMAVGPFSAQEAEKIWGEVSRQVCSIEDLFSRSDLGESDRKLTELIRSYRVSLMNENSILARSVREMEPKLVKNAAYDLQGDRGLIDKLGLNEFLVSPLVARGEAIGALLVDNRFSKEPIRQHQVNLLEDFAAQASLAIGNALAYQKLRDQMVELKRTQDRLVNAERMASVGRMASHLAHEIRNPLTTVGGFARSIQRNCRSPEVVKRNAEIIYEEAMRLEEVLNSALDFSRPVRLSKAACNLNGLIRDIADEYKDVFRKRGIALQIDLDEDVPDIEADVTQLKQVFINLMNNAFDALQNTGEKKLLFGTVRSGDYIVVSVSDSGEGMDEETRRNIFSPFFTTKKGGSGLGLSISRKIIEKHGGSMEVDSSLGKGAAFYLKLPCDKTGS